VVVEGPSGIGKTTAVQKAVAEAGLDKRVLMLSARRPDDVQLISSLHEQLPLGTVIVDDFHRLPDENKSQLADLMKVLADTGATDSKLIVLGINKAGERLVSFAETWRTEWRSSRSSRTRTQDSRTTCPGRECLER